MAATNTQANGFFGANLKYSGYDAIVFQGRAPAWVYLYIQDETWNCAMPARCSARIPGRRRMRCKQTLGLSGHQLSVYTSGMAGENQVRFAAIHGDYGHVASKNGCGAVMGNKQVKAVAIVRGSKALTSGRYRGAVLRPPMRSPTTCSTIRRRGRSTNMAPCRASSGLSRLGALPIKNYTTNVVPEGVDMDSVDAPRACATASITAAISAMPAACITATRKCCPPVRTRGDRGRARVRRLVGGGLGHGLYRSGGRVLAQHADGSGLRGCQ